MIVYLINLDRSPDRLAWFSSQAERLKLDLVRIAAVDAHALSDRELKRLRGLSSGRNSLSAAELACFLSHLEAWKRIAASKDPWAFVAEDDLHFAEAAAPFLEGDAWISSGTGLVKAETALKRVELSAKVAGRPFGFELRRLHSYHHCSGGYFVSRAAAADLLDFTETHCETIDEVLFSPQHGMARRLNAMQLMPAICVQDAIASSRQGGTRLPSLISEDRTSFRRLDPRSPRPRGVAKFRREVSRVGRQIVGFFRTSLLVLGHRRIVQVVPYADGECCPYGGPLFSTQKRFSSD